MRTVVGGNWWLRILREVQVAGLSGQWLGELLGENFERGTGNWPGRTVVRANCWVRIVSEEQGAGLAGQWLGRTAG